MSPLTATGTDQAPDSDQVQIPVEAGGGCLLALLALGSLLAACSDSTGPAEPEPEPEGSWLMVQAGSCGLTLEREAFCWGLDNHGQLGQGNANENFHPPRHFLVPSPVVGGLKFEWIDTGGGGRFTCALTPAGEAFCWGSNLFGQIGQGTLGGATDTPTPVIGGLTFERIHTGGGHACALTSAGEAYCWGSNEFGQLGDGTTDTRLSPVPVSGGLTFRQITTGTSHTCALTFEDGAFCWGRNEMGQLGKGTFDDPSVAASLPAPVDTELSFREISTGRNTTCSLTLEGRAFCWGDNLGGQIGDLSRVDRPAPTLVASAILPSGGRGVGFEQISVGGGTTCALTAGGEAFCWGNNSFGQFDDGTKNDFFQPTSVSGGLVFRQISVSSSGTTCGVTVDDELFCWGRRGFVGDGTMEDRLVPTRIAPPEE